MQSIHEQDERTDEEKIRDFLEFNPNPDFTQLDTDLHEQLTECLADPDANQADCFFDFDYNKAFYAKVQDYLARNTQ